MQQLERLVLFSQRVGKPLQIMIQFVNLSWVNIYNIMPVALFLHKYDNGRVDSIIASEYEEDQKKIAPGVEAFGNDKYKVKLHLRMITPRLNKAIATLLSTAVRAKTSGRSQRQPARWARLYWYMPKARPTK